MPSQLFVLSMLELIGFCVVVQLKPYVVLQSRLPKPKPAAEKKKSKK
jgi:hypothetical protein